MINPAIADALARIRRMQDDLQQAYVPGFEPQSLEFSASQRPFPEDDPLSVAAPPGTYFVVGPPGAPGFTRDGSFELVDGALRTRSGQAVLGVGPRGGPLVPIRVDDVDRALARIRDPRIGSDGKLTYTRSMVDPRSGERRTESVVSATVALARFPAGTIPVRVDATRVQAPRGVSPHVGVPGDGHLGPLATYSRDGGRMDFVDGLERLADAYQLLEAIRASGKAHGNAEKAAMDLLK
jgi:hypothetical protein